MITDRRHLLKLLPCAGMAALTGCDESEEQRKARLERTVNDAMITQRINASAVTPTATDPNKAELTPEEKAANDPTKKLVLVCASDLSVPFLRVQAEMMRTAVRTLNGYRYKVLDAAGDATTQLDQLRQAEAEHPLWLLIHPVEDRLAASLLEPLRRTGVKVIGLDQRMDAAACDAVIFTDQYQLGRLAGQVVVNALRRKAKDEHREQVTGRVVQIRGKEEAFASKACAEGFAEALHQEPGIIVVHDAPCDWTTATARLRAKDALRLQHDFDVIFAHNDAMAQGASEAMTEAQMRDHMLIVGIDAVGGHLGGLDLLRRSVIDATIWQPMPMELAFAAIQKTASNKPTELKPRMEREPVAVTPATLEEFTRKLQGGGR